MDLQTETNVDGSSIRLKVSFIAHGIQLQVVKDFEKTFMLNTKYNTFRAINKLASHNG
jgi:hypothetical protein